MIKAEFLEVSYRLYP